MSERTKIQWSFYAENKMRGKYKIFYILPAISIARDTQSLRHFGCSSWEIYFEWLWFMISIHRDKDERRAFIYDDRIDNPEMYGTVSLYDLNDEKYFIKTPFVLHVIVENDEYVGEIPELDLVEYGGSLSDLIENVRNQVKDICFMLYDASSKELSKNERAVKKVLRKNVMLKKD